MFLSGVGGALKSGSENQNRASGVSVEGGGKATVCILHFASFSSSSDFLIISFSSFFFILPHLALFPSLRNINMGLKYIIRVCFYFLTKIYFIFYES